MERPSFTSGDNYYFERGNHLLEIAEIKEFLDVRDTCELVVLASSAGLSCGSIQLNQVARKINSCEHKKGIVLISDRPAKDHEEFVVSTFGIIQYWCLSTKEAKALGINFTASVMYVFAGGKPIKCELAI